MEAPPRAGGTEITEPLAAEAVMTGFDLPPEGAPVYLAFAHFAAFKRLEDEIAARAAKKRETLIPSPGRPLLLNTELDKTADLVREIMENCYKGINGATIEVPLNAEAGNGHSWAEAH